MDPGAYCREVETYLCRKNDGHLIRVAGPAFDLVAGWARKGIPLKVALGGIDRSFERYHARGMRRRPLRVEFCDADVLDLFDEWRRAVGIARVASEEPAAEERRPRGGLQKHVERVLARLRTLARDGRAPAALREGAVRVIYELETSGAADRPLRGTARAGLIARLGALDREMIALARATMDSQTLAEVERDARGELQPFAARMPGDAFDAAVAAAADRLVRERSRLPALRFE
jgi:hypothetical protein